MSPILVLTRPEPEASRFAEALFAAWGQSCEVLRAPAFRIVPVEVSEDLSGTDHVVLTSANGVRQLDRLDIPKAATAWCVGNRTAEEARAVGFEARSAGGDAADLVALIAEAAPRGRMVHVSGRHTRGDVAGRLRALGLDCRAVVAYEQVEEPPTAALLGAMQGNRPLVAPVFSPRSTLSLMVANRTAPLHVIAMSGAVAQAVEGLDADTVRVARQPDGPAMTDATLEVLGRLVDMP